MCSGPNSIYRILKYVPCTCKAKVCVHYPHPYSKIACALDFNLLYENNSKKDCILVQSSKRFDKICFNTTQSLVRDFENKSVCSAPWQNSQAVGI